jgi:hypothetical protein
MCEMCRWFIVVLRVLGDSDGLVPAADRGGKVWKASVEAAEQEPHCACSGAAQHRPILWELLQ